MNWQLQRCLPSSLLLAIIAATAQGMDVVTFEDIQFWTGEGTSQAAIAIDWNSESSADESLVWGYRWDGVAQGEDMFRAVLEADPHFYAKLSPPGAFGTAVYGVGYDRNYDCQLNLSDGTYFNDQGLNISGIPDQPPPAATSLDPEDYYEEGWFTGFWHYGVGNGNPFDGGTWVSSQLGMSSRVLSDGDWDGWTFSQTFNFSAFPENPYAAETLLTADFDCNAAVDGFDFLAWQRGYGTLSGAQLADGDATGDGAVDEEDLARWTAEYGNFHPPIIGAQVAAAASVPEPTSSALTLCVLFIWLFVRQGSFT